MATYYLLGTTASDDDGGSGGYNYAILKVTQEIALKLLELRIQFLIKKAICPELERLSFSQDSPYGSLFPLWIRRAYVKPFLETDPGQFLADEEVAEILENYDSLEDWECFLEVDGEKELLKLKKLPCAGAECHTPYYHYLRIYKSGFEFTIGFKHSSSEVSTGYIYWENFASTVNLSLATPEKPVVLSHTDFNQILLLVQRAADVPHLAAEATAILEKHNSQK